MPFDAIFMTALAGELRDKLVAVSYTHLTLPTK